MRLLDFLNSNIENIASFEVSCTFTTIHYKDGSHINIRHDEDNFEMYGELHDKDGKYINMFD